MDISTEPRQARHGGPADNTEKYLYQIRNMLAWIMILIGLSIAAGIVTGVVVASHSGHQAAASCQSQGGIDPSC